MCALRIQVTDLKEHVVIVTKKENQTTFISKQETAVRACQGETQIYYAEIDLWFSLVEQRKSEIFYWPANCQTFWMGYIHDWSESTENP